MYYVIYLTETDGEIGVSPCVNLDQIKKCIEQKNLENDVYIIIEGKWIRNINNIIEQKPKLDKCPDCGQNTVRAKELHEGGGVECTNPKCNYWFCY